MISLRTIPFMVSNAEELQAWLQVQDLRLAHDYEIPSGWKLITLAPVGCVLMSTGMRKANERESMIGFELVPDTPRPSIMRDKAFIPLDFETLGFLPSGQYVLVKSTERKQVAV